MSFDSNNSETFPHHFKKIEVQSKEIKAEIGNDAMFVSLVNSFKTLSESRRRESKYISLYWITERSLVSNFHKVFQHRCDIFAKILYIKMSDKKDFAKIDFV
jgi:hypothetical protein